MIKAIIFDFDGVIAESLKVKADAFSEIYKPYGKEIANKVIEHHHENGGMSRNEKFKHYHKEFLNKAISNVELDKLCVQFSNLVIKKVVLSSYVPGVMDFISSNYKKYTMIISTGTPLDEIKKIIQGRKINKYFIDVFGAPVNKTLHIQEVMKKYHFINQEILFIGDANTDIRAAAQHNIPFILRIHKFNKNLFCDYKGRKIRNFLNFSISELDQD